MPAAPKHHLYLALLTAAVSLLAGILLALALTRFINQLRANAFLPTTGTIDSIQETASSDAARPDDPASTAFSLNLHYHYFIKGERYDATRLRYGSNFGSHLWTSALLRQIPAGAQVPIYYNPANPAQSVIIRGFQSADYLPLILLIPLTVITLLLWIILYGTLRIRARFAGLDIVQQPGVTRIRPAKTTAFAAGAVFIAGSSVVVFLILLLLAGFHPSTSLALAAALFATLPGILTVFLLLFQLHTGKRDILLDDSAKTLTMPARKDLQIPYQSLVSIHIVESEKLRIRGQPLLSVLLRYKAPPAPPAAPPTAAAATPLPMQQHLRIQPLIFAPESADRLALFLSSLLKIPAYSAANSRLVDPDAPPKPEPRTQPAIRPVFSNPYQSFKPTHRPPR